MQAEVETRMLKNCEKWKYQLSFNWLDCWLFHGEWYRIWKLLKENMRFIQIREKLFEKLLEAFTLGCFDYCFTLKQHK